MAGRIGPLPPPPSIVIGTQTWTLNNLDVVRYRNGDSIPQVTDATEWSNLTTGAWCYYDNDPANGAIYGKMYNWYAATDPRVLAPIGFHIPSNEEWTILIDYLGGSDVAGGELKEIGTTHWTNPNTGATNSSGFTALPGGSIQNSPGFPAGFNNINAAGYYLTSTETVEYYACNYMSYFSDNVIATTLGKTAGVSVRCIKD